MALRVRIPKPGPGLLEQLTPLLSGQVQLVAEAPYDVLVMGVPGREQVEGCKAVVVPYAGVPKRTRELMADLPGVALYNLHHNALPTAELAIALFLAAAKRIVPLDRALRQGDWSARYGEERDLLVADRRALILGFGAVGREVGSACAMLGMEIKGVGRRDPQDLAPLLPEADALFVCLPWTDETQDLIGERELALLPGGAILVNVARGPIVNEKALYDALASGRIRAGLDVWYRYPKDEQSRSATPPSGYPFHELDNVVFSPHRGGLSDRTEALRAEHLARLLNTLAAGGDPESRVDLERGY